MKVERFTLELLRKAEAKRRVMRRTHPLTYAALAAGIAVWAGGVWWLAKDPQYLRWSGILFAAGFFGSLLAVPVALRMSVSAVDETVDQPCPGCHKSLVGHSLLIERTGHCPLCACLLGEQRNQTQSPALLNLDDFHTKTEALRASQLAEIRLITNWFLVLLPTLLVVMCAAPILGRETAGALLWLPGGLLVGMLAHLIRRSRVKAPTQRCPACQGWLLGGKQQCNPLALASGCCPHCRAALFPHALPMPAGGTIPVADYLARRKELSKSENLWWSVGLAGMALGLAVGITGSHSTGQGSDGEGELVITMLALMYGPILPVLLALRKKTTLLGLRCPQCGAGLCTQQVLVFGECERCRTPVLHR